MRPSLFRRAPFLLAVLCGFLWSCSINTVTGPTTATGGNNNNGGPSTPGASPSPGTGGDLPPGSFVRVGLFGQSCPSGTTPPNNGTRTIGPGCTGFITATPKDAQGNDIPAAVHGSSIAWVVEFGQGIVNLIAPPEPFNRDARCTGPGDFGLKATVKNVSGATTFTCAAGAGTRAATLDSPHRVYFWSDDATEEQKAAAIERDRARYSRGQVSAQNCNNCHPPVDVDVPPTTCGTCR